MRLARRSERANDERAIGALLFAGSRERDGRDRGLELRVAAGIGVGGETSVPHVEEARCSARAEAIDERARDQRAGVLLEDEPMTKCVDDPRVPAEAGGDGAR